jgi:hypothetical protein
LSAGLEKSVLPVPENSAPAYPRMRYGRLILALLLAVVVHIFVFAVFHQHRVAPLSLPVPALTVQLPPVIYQRKNFEGDALHRLAGTGAAHPGLSRPVGRIQFSHQTAGTNPLGKESVPTVAALPAVQASPASSVTADGLLDSAKQIVRDEAHRMHTGKDEAMDFEARSMLPALAQAMQKQTAGETRFADGLIKVVTPMGTVYCLKAPSADIGRGGVDELVAVPTTCP